MYWLEKMTISASLTEIHFPKISEETPLIDYFTFAPFTGWHIVGSARCLEFTVECMCVVLTCYHRALLLCAFTFPALQKFIPGFYFNTYLLIAMNCGSGSSSVLASFFFNRNIMDLKTKC